MTDRRGARATTGAVLWLLLAITVATQLVVLYAPSAPSVSPFCNSDKAVHVVVFLVPVLLALLAGLRPRVVVAVFAAHAVASELVQHALLPGRSGDPLDVVADLAGVGLGVLVWWLLVGRTGRGARGVVGRMPRRW